MQLRYDIKHRFVIVHNHFVLFCGSKIVGPISIFRKQTLKARSLETYP